ncbi:MAG: hypothetical protein ACK5X3_16225, partial [Pseudomonadota bacterium]
MIKDLSINWGDMSTQPLEGTCLGCQTKGPMKLVCEVTNLFSADSHLIFGRCPRCASLTVIKGSLFDYTDSELSPEIWRHYMQLGAGIDSMVRPIQRVANGKPEASLLDVGCGFGYTLDFFRHVLGKKIAGVEPSTYGRMGR